MDRRDPGEIKRAKRVAIEADGLLVDSDGVESRIIVTDLSAEGCRVRSEKLLLIGERVKLRVGRVGEYPAQVRWALENEAGLAFTGPVEPIG